MTEPKPIYGVQGMNVVGNDKIPVEEWNRDVVTRLTAGDVAVLRDAVNWLRQFDGFLLGGHLSAYMDYQDSVTIEKCWEELKKIADTAERKNIA